MNILVTGVCGFDGRVLAEGFISAGLRVTGADNLSRAGSELNRGYLKKLGVRVIHWDIHSATDLNEVPAADWVVDAAANPTVLAGIDGKTSSRQLVEHNLLGTANLLEYSLLPLLLNQMHAGKTGPCIVMHVSGGAARSMSLAQLSAWCGSDSASTLSHRTPRTALSTCRGSCSIPRARPRMDLASANAVA
ncbi:MAG TPA: NAD-dependent epimerase/dehydratase family protein [Chthoniobacterales bacterium]|nr:NAD-dependent epimerase/dehydratase family protein [Chthoniobacterales bacterium]